MELPTNGSGGKQIHQANAISKGIPDMLCHQETVHQILAWSLGSQLLEPDIGRFPYPDNICTYNFSKVDST